MPPRLPVDVVQIVLDELFIWEDDTLMHLYGVVGRRVWLAKVLTISRAWYAAVVPLLYRTIEFYPADRVTLDLLLRTFRRRPHLARFVRVLKPYEREYSNRDPRVDPRAKYFRDWGRILIMEWMLKDRDERRKARHMRKLTALAKMCTNLEELHIDSSDVHDFQPVLKTVALQLRRLVLEAAHRLDMAALHAAADWSSLRSLKLDASRKFELGRSRKHGIISSRDISVFETMISLVELEVLGWVTPRYMRDILQLLRQTLRSLACNQLVAGMQPSEWLAPVKHTLHKLTLYVHAKEPVCDLSSLAAVKVLHIVILDDTDIYHGATTFSRSQSRFPPTVEKLECMFFDPLMTPIAVEQRMRLLLLALSDPLVPAITVKQRMRALLEDSNREATPNRRDIVLRVTVRKNNRRSTWESLNWTLQDQCTRRSLNYQMQFERDCTQSDCDDPEDVFAFATYLRRVAREQQVRDLVSRRRSPNCVLRALVRARRTVNRIWTRCCCVAWCCCCCCPCFRCPDWFL